MGDRFYKISDDIKRCVEFKKSNLLKDPYPTGCHLIVCRNVLIYFTEEAKKDVYEKFNKSLVTDGCLFVGNTEQIIGYKDMGTAMTIFSSTERLINKMRNRNNISLVTHF